MTICKLEIPIIGTKEIADLPDKGILNNHFFVIVDCIVGGPGEDVNNQFCRIYANNHDLLNLLSENKEISKPEKEERYVLCDGYALQLILNNIGLITENQIRMY